MHSLSFLLAATLFTLVASAQDFQFIRISATKACVKFRTSSSTSTYSVVRDTLYTEYITQQSAQFLCKSYYPAASTGVFENSNGECYYTAATSTFDSLRIDCPYDASTASSCNLTGSYSPSTQSYFYGVALSCIVPTWSSTSSTTSYASTMLITGGGNVSKPVSLTVENIEEFDYVRPGIGFSYGTICLSNTTAPSIHLLSALCRTANAPSANATLVDSSDYTTSAQRYISNIQCTSSATATLWNGGCTFSTHFYDTPQDCTGSAPRVKCGNTFDVRLGSPIAAAGLLSGFQNVQLRQQGTETFDGSACLATSSTYNTATYFANSVCQDIYGAGEFDFAAAYTGSVADNSNTTVINNIACSYGANSLSLCSSSLATPSSTSCTTYRAIVTCKMNELNTRFSLDGTTIGTGYLMASVAAAGQTTPAAVCYDGFDQTAARAACRSVGYTPGTNVSFVLSTASSTHAINNVTCPSTAKKLTECKLQYSGTGYKISYAASQVCAGRVYIDCGITKSPSVQFRTTPSPNYYLQARLFADSEWGWVETGYGISNYEANIAMCAKVTSTTGDPNINSMFLSVSWCPINVSSYTDCQYVYENGAPASTGFACSSSYLPSSSTARANVAPDSGLAIGLGAAGGAIALVVLIVVVVVCCKMQSSRATATNGNRAGTSGSGEEMSWHRTNNAAAPPATTYNYNNSSDNGATVMGWHRPVQQQQQLAQNNFYASNNAYSNHPSPPTAGMNGGGGVGLYGNPAPTVGLFGDQYGGAQQQQHSLPQMGLYQNGKSGIY